MARAALTSACVLALDQHQSSARRGGDERRRAAWRGASRTSRMVCCRACGMLALAPAASTLPAFILLRIELSVYSAQLFAGMAIGGNTTMRLLRHAARTFILQQHVSPAMRLQRPVGTYTSAAVASYRGFSGAPHLARKPRTGGRCCRLRMPPCHLSALCLRMLQRLSRQNSAPVPRRVCHAYALWLPLCCAVPLSLLPAYRASSPAAASVLRACAGSRADALPP